MTLTVVTQIVTILILIDGFLQCFRQIMTGISTKVTILILIDGFLQFNKLIDKVLKENSHNPYFNRWFSAIQ